MTAVSLARPAAAGHSRRFAVATLAALFLATASGCGPSEPPPAEVAMEELKADIDVISEQSQRDPGAPIDPFQIGPAAADESGRMHQLMRQFMNSVFQVRNAYLGELSAMGWDRILDADRLKADTGMVESRRMLGQAREAMTRAQAASVAAFDAFPGLVQGADLSAANKRDLMAGFDEAKANGLEQIRGSFALEAQTLDEFEAMVDLLDRVEWEVQASQIMFQTDADVETFNGHFTRIQELTAQLQARQQSNLDQARKTASGAGQ